MNTEARSNEDTVLIQFALAKYQITHELRLNINARLAEYGKYLPAFFSAIAIGIGALYPTLKGTDAFLFVLWFLSLGAFILGCLAYKRLLRLRWKKVECEETLRTIEDFFLATDEDISRMCPARADPKKDAEEGVARLGGKFILGFNGIFLSVLLTTVIMKVVHLVGHTISPAIIALFWCVFWALGSYCTHRFYPRKAME